MSVVGPEERARFWPDGASSSGCFKCDEPVFFDQPAVAWYGGVSGAVLLLHPACAAKLATDLLGDAQQAGYAFPSTSSGPQAGRAW